MTINLTRLHTIAVSTQQPRGVNMTRTITHKHLKRQFEIFEETEDLDNLFAELEFSTLLLPVSTENNALSFPILRAGGKRYAPVFTDLHEYNKFYFGEGFTLVPNDFNFYIDLLDEDIDGIIIDAEGERFPLTNEIRGFIKPNHAFDYNRNVLTANEIKQIKDSISNTDLEEFLKDESNRWDYENLMGLLLKSYLFKVGLSRNELEAENGIICLERSLPAAISTRFSERYALIYTSECEVRPKINPMHPYLQLVNLPELINRVLLDDLDGIILNENSQNITIPRGFLIDFMRDFDCPNGNHYDDYAFVLEE